MNTLVETDVEQFARPPGERLHRRLDDSCITVDDGEDGPVVDGVGMDVYTGAASSVLQRIENRTVTTLAEVDDTLEHCEMIMPDRLVPAPARVSGPVAISVSGRSRSGEPAATSDAPTLPFGRTAPYAMVDVVGHGVLEAG
jgi:hypothetical protein